MNQAQMTSAWSRRVITWIVVLALNITAGAVLLPHEISRGLVSGILTADSQLLDLSPVQWGIGAILMLGSLLVKWLFITGVVLFIGAFAEANEGFGLVGHSVAQGLIPLAIGEMVKTSILATRMLPSGKEVVLDLSVLVPAAHPLFTVSLMVSNPFLIWSVWVTAQGLIGMNVHRYLKTALIASGLAFGSAEVLGSVLF